MNRTKNELELIKCIVDLFPADVIREVEKKKQELQQDNYFGNCSVCGASDEYLNVVGEEYYVCNEHKKYWLGFSKLPPYPSECTEDAKKAWEKAWEKDSKILNTYKGTYEEITGREWLENIINPVIEENMSLPY